MLTVAICMMAVIFIKVPLLRGEALDTVPSNSLGTNQTLDTSSNNRMVDSLLAKRKIEQEGDLQHLTVFDFSSLPPFVEQMSSIESGIIYFGPSGDIGGHNFLIQLLSISVSTNCNLLKQEEVLAYNALRYVLVSLNINKTCWIRTSQTSLDKDGTARSTQKNINLDPANLPSTSCDSSIRSMASTKLSWNPPGAELSLTTSGMEFVTSQLLWSKDNLTIIYIKNNYLPCLFIAKKAGRQLLSTSCNINIEDPDHDDHQKVHISVLNPGDIQVITETYVKNDYCSHECSYPVEDTSYVLVTCPNGFQHRLQISKDYRKTCPGAQISYVGWVGTFLCRGSDRPITFSFFIVWVLFGYILIQLMVVILIWLMRMVNYLMGKTIHALDEELGICPICSGPYMDRKKVKDHLNCSKGICAYCKKIFSVNTIGSHVKSCPGYEACKLRFIQSSLDPDTKLKQFISWFEVQTYFKAFSKSVYFVILLSTFLVVISPVKSQSIDDVLLSDSNLEKEKLMDKFFYSEQPFIIPEFSELFDSTSIFGAESELCGKTCWNGPNQCKCSSDDLKEITDSIFGDELSLVRKELELQDQHAAEGIIEDLDQSSQSPTDIGYNRTYMSYNPSTNKTDVVHYRKRRYIVSKGPRNLSPYNRKNTQVNPDVGNCVDCHVEDNAYIHLTNKRGDFHSELGLYSIEKVQTDWGIVTIDDNLQPTYDSTNLDVQWETTKNELNKVTVGGTVIGKLNIGHNSGITWTIGSKDSNEKKKLTLFIYDAVQEYQGKTSFVTGSRYTKTWFRGVCTGDCPNKCACTKKTCYHKIFDYDRKWTCNPGWCWTINGGCSCCAVDLEARLPRWTIVKQDLTYLGNNLIFCLKLGSEKLQCTSTKENKKITFRGVSITISKAYGEIKHLPETVSTVFYSPQTGSVQYKQPDFYWIKDDVCEKSCKHGDVGDFKSGSLADWHSDTLTPSVISSNPNVTIVQGTQSVGMDWTGLDVEHTCHTGSWPECNYYNLKENIDDLIKNVNQTASHLSEQFELRYSSVVQSGIAIGVLPKRLTGMIDFTIQVSGVELSRKELKFETTSFKVSNCKGCYACSSGFECVGEVTVKTKGKFNVHLYSKNPLVSVDQSTRTIEAIESSTVKFPIHAISLLNETNVEFCIEESSSCTATNFKLEEPVKKLMKRETIVSIKSNDDLNQSKCTGLGWIACTFTNGKNFFSNIWDWFKYLYVNLNAIFWSIIPIAIGLLVAFLVYRLYIWYKSRKEMKKLIGKGPQYLLNKFKEEEKRKLDKINGVTHEPSGKRSHPKDSMA